MAYFTQDYLDFFKELAANNHRDWFHANKKRYENSVKEPFRAFVQEMINRVTKDDPSTVQNPKECIFRINRDIRFSKDKTPYKTQMSAVVSPGGRKNMHIPGIYFELGPENVKYYGGLYMLDKEQLHNMRTHIANHLDEFDKLLNDKGFKDKFETISGDQHKRIPKEFKEAAEKQPLIANKQFYYFAKLDPQLITSSKLADILMEHYHTANPMKQFLREGIGL